MTRVATATIDLGALKSNLAVAREAAPSSEVMAVIKADAYGHGMVRVAKSLSMFVGAFGVASINEAIQLRAAGIQTPITILEGFNTVDDLHHAAEHKLAVVLHDNSQMGLFALAKNISSLTVWLKIDTGMHRLGFAPGNVIDIIKAIQSFPFVQDLRLMTHFANADDRANPATQKQIEQFDEIAGKTKCATSLANSAGVLGFPAAHADWIRPGIMLYGVNPFIDTKEEDATLHPVMTLKSSIIAIKELNTGDKIGYGGTYTCPEDMRVAVVSIGYGDGYPRHAQSGTPVLLNGKRIPLVGRVSMDMITVDLRTQPDAQVGDPVVLWGQGLSVEVIAEHAGTIGYELLCGVTQRVLFEYTE